MATIKLASGEQFTTAELEANMHSDEFYYGHLTPANDVLSYSSLKWLLKSPKWFDWKRRNPDPETQALRDGRLVHAAILEPRKYESFQFIDVSSKNTKKYRLAVEQYGKANTFTTKEKYMNTRIVDAFLANDMCTRHLEGAETEVPRFWTYKGMNFRMKADIIQGTNCIDVKTTGDDLEYFARTIQKYDYDLQAYMYMNAYNCDTFTWLIIDKVTTDIGYVQIDSEHEVYLSGQDKFYRAVDTYDTFFVSKDLDLHQYYKEIVV